MKGIYTGIKRFAAHDGQGLRTTVFLKGCPLRCVWCHNPEGLSPRPQVSFFQELCIGCGGCAAVCKSGAVTGRGEARTVRPSLCRGCGACAASCPVNARVLQGTVAEHQRLAQLLMQDKPFFDMGGGVTFSGGECMLQWEFLYHTAQLLRQEGVGVDIDTCGHAPWEAFEALLPLTDWFLYDFKAFDPEVHKQCTGVENGLIKENLERLSRAGASVEIRFPLVMGYNDSQLAKTARYLSGLRIEKVKILPFHDYSHSKYEALGMEDALPSHDSVPTRQDLCRAASAFEQHGIRAEVSG